MKSFTPCVVMALIWGLSVLPDVSNNPPVTSDPAAISLAKLAPSLDRKEVTIQFSVEELGGVSQLTQPGKPRTFVIEAASDDTNKDLTVWIDGELAEILDRLQLSYFGSNPLKKGTTIVATGRLTFSPGEGDSKGHEWYSLSVEKWQNFRIVGPDDQDGQQSQIKDQRKPRDGRPE